METSEIVVWFVLPHGKWVKYGEEEAEIHWQPYDNESEKGDN